MDFAKKNAKQLEYNKKWMKKNKEHSSYLKSRSSARSFIKNKATRDDLEELLNIINQKKLEFNE